MNYFHISMWRKGFILSATFLLLTLVGVSCKKKRSDVGTSLIHQNDLLHTDGIDTFQLITYSMFEDSTITRSASGNPSRMLLGNYNDPVFGEVQTSIYTQLQLAQVNPPFNVAVTTVDSMVLSFEYSGFYGNSGDQTFEVYRLIDKLEADSVYYASDTLQKESTSLVELGSEIVEMDQYNVTVVGEDTVSSQLRIRLNTTLGDDFLTEFDNSPSTFADNDAFLDFFKGLYIKSVSTPVSNSGGIAYFDMSDPDTKLTMFYTEDTVQKSYEFKINTDCVRFNHYDVQRTSTGLNVQNVIDNNSLGQSEFYAQSFNTRAVVEIPGLNNIPKNAIIHDAVLELPIQYQTGHKYGPGDFLRTSTRTDENSDDLYDILVLGTFDNASKQFTFDLRNYVQSVVKGDLPNTELYISPLFFVSSADRIIFNGPTTVNKMKPKFRIIYTEF